MAGGSIQLRSAFHLPVPVDEAWPIVEDVPTLARCLPNVRNLQVMGDRCEGTLAVAIGLVKLSLSGSARIVTRSSDRHSVTIEASGTQGGPVPASASIYVQLLPHRDETIVTVVTELPAEGALARLGQVPLAMASDRYWRGFGERLTQQLRPDSTPVRRAPLSGAVGRVGSTLRFVRSAVS